MKTSRHKKITLKIIFSVVLFFCLIGGGIYFFLFSRFFRVKEVVVSGNQEVSTTEVQSLIWRQLKANKFWLLPKDNVFLIKPRELAADLEDNFVKIASVAISRHAPQRVPTIEINISERQAQAIVCHISRDTPWRVSTEGGQTQNNDLQKTTPVEIFNQCFYVDQEGIAFKTAPQTQGSLILLIGARYDLALGWEAVKPKLLKAVLQAQKELTAKLPALLSDYFLVATATEFHLKTKQGWRVFFDTAADINYQVAVLKELLDKKIKETKNLEYIDLRVGDRVYYK